jgi:hypothetical protein
MASVVTGSSLVINVGMALSNLNSIHPLARFHDLPFSPPPSVDTVENCLCRLLLSRPK